MHIRELIHRLACAVFLAAIVAGCVSAPARAPLTLEVFTAGARGYGVTSAIVYGATEAAIIDAQFTVADATLLADRVEALNRRVTTVFVTHPDTDHVVGLGVLRERFPGARIYMTPSAIASYRATIATTRAQFAGSSRPAEAPPEEPIAEPLAGDSLVVDGQRLEIIPDLQGDTARARVNSVVWIPSSRALIASDMAFDDVHVYLEDSTPQSRAAWRAALVRLEAMQPALVVAGHKSDAARADAPGSLAATRIYLEAFEQRFSESQTAAALETSMLEAYPGYAYPLFLTVSARSVLPIPPQ
jgi:glyoxylase-like metal-dependent hydrolase (beta-lactamase superfamily II)